MRIARLGIISTLSVALYGQLSPGQQYIPDPTTVGLWHTDKQSGQFLTNTTAKVKTGISTEGLVGYWPFNGNANDESGNGNNGTVFGAVLTEDRFRDPNSAYEFDGVDDYILISDDSSTDFSGDFTLAAWIRHSGAANQTSGDGWRIISKHETYGANLYHYRVAGPSSNVPDGLIEFEMRINGGDLFEASGTTNVKDRVWHFVVALRTGNEMKVYVDGTEEGSTSATAEAVAPAAPLTIGNNLQGPNDHFDGLIDDVRIYDRALGDEEILELYNEMPADPLALDGVSYGSTGSAEPNNPGALITIDPLTGAGTLIGPTGIIGDDGAAVRALAIKSTGEMYALSNTASSDLYTVNASTGAGTFIANTGLLHPGDMVFDANDVLYAVDETNTFYAVDPVTGVRTVVGPTGATLGGLAYDPTDGTVYGSDNNDGIFTIDVTTGAATLVGATGLGGNTPDILFDQTGNLFGVKKSAGGISDYIAINKTTGAGTVIGPTGFVAVVGLATRLQPPPAVPCSDITRFQARCRLGGTIQVRIILLNTTHTGDLVEFTIDGTPYQVSVESNGRALLSIGVFAVGDHTVELTDPPGCFDPLTVRCSAGVAKPGDDFWDDDASWEAPTTTALLGNFPNPFNPSTTIRYALTEPGHVTLSVYDMLGQLVKTVVNDYQSGGYHESIWDGRNESGLGVASGIYIYRMTLGNFVQTKRMLLLK